MSVNIVHPDGSLEKIAGMGFGEPGPQGPQGPQGPAGEAADYEGLSNQPRINSIRLTGNKSSADLGLQPNMSTAAQLSFGALASLTAYLNSNRKIPNNSTIHINDYDTDYVVSARAEGDTEDNCIFISDTQKITPLYQLGKLDIRAFGAGHANTAENSAKIVKAIKYAQSAGIKLYVPQGKWYLKESIPLSGATIIEGATSGGDRGLYLASCSVLFFDPEQSNISMFTESGTHTLSIRHITLVCGKTVGNEKQLYTTYEGNYTTQVAEIPHNYMAWTYSYENVNCLNCYNDSNPRGASSWLDLLDVNIVGFSGYGVKCGMALALDSVRFQACKYGFYNVLTDTQFHNTFIQGCEYGFYWNNGGTVLHAYDTWIDQCKYGVYSTNTLAGIFQGGEIDHCLYAGVCCLGSSDLKIEARFGRLGMYYLGEDMLTKAQAITSYTEEAFLDMSKGVDIAIRWGNKFNFDLSEEPRNISDNGTETSKLPTLLVFGQTLRGIIKTAHDFADRAYYAIQNACVTTIDAYNLTDIAELPAPAAYRLGKLFLLTEEQTGYTKGGIYKCVALGTNPETYEWELINEDKAPNDTYELPLYRFDNSYAFYPQNGKMTGTSKETYSAKRYDVRNCDAVYATFSTDTRSTLFSFVLFIDDNLNVIEEKCRVQTATNYVREKMIVPEGATYCSITYYNVDNDCKLETNRLYNPLNGENPIARPIPTGGFANIFRKIGVVGDSISCGDLDVNNGASAVDNWDDYAWANFMKRKTGCEVVKLAQGGLQVANWLDTHYSSDALVAENKADSYFFMLGHNDQNHITGSVSDINVADLPSSDNTTTYGKYGRIVGVCKTASPKAKLFFITYPVPQSGTLVDEVNTMIREVCTTVGGYLIDLALYDKTIKQFKMSKTVPHYTPLGYYVLSEDIMTYLDYIVRHNLSAFADIGYVTKDYSF